MALNTITLKWNVTDLIQGGQTATLIITPTAQLADSTDHVLVAQPVPRRIVFSGGQGQLAGIVANDNENILPAGTGYTIEMVTTSGLGTSGAVIIPEFTTQLLFSNGATQWLDALAPVASVTTQFQYLPLPSGSPVAGDVPVVTSSGSEATTWQPVSGSGAVASVFGRTGAVVATTGDYAAAQVGAVATSAVGAASGVQGLDAAQRLVTPVGSFLVPSPGPVSRRPAWRAASYAQIFQTGHGWSATGAGVGSSNLNDTSTFVKGTQCATITTAGNGAQANFRSTTVPTQNLAGNAVRLTFQVVNVTNLNEILLYVGSSSFTNYFLWTVHTATNPATTQNIIQSGEWVTITVPWANVQSASGSFSISSAGVPSTQSGMTAFQVAVLDNAAGSVTMHLQAVEVIPDTVNTFPNGVVSIVFDDSYQDVWTYARPVMDTYGYRGTAYTIAQAIGAGGSLTLSQLQQMQDFSGWEVGGHAYTSAAHSAGYETLTALQVEDEMRYLRAWMQANGFPLDSFAYPSGFFSSTTDGVPIDQICSQYFSTGRSIISETYETFPPGMPYRVRAKTGISSAGTAVSVITATGGPLDRCQLDGSWYVITLHDVITGTPSVSTQISTTDFSTLMAAINTRGIPVLPVGDVIRNYS